MRSGASFEIGVDAHTVHRDRDRGPEPDPSGGPAGPRSGPRRRAAAPSLDGGTQLTAGADEGQREPEGGAWTVRVFEDCGEAVGWVDRGSARPEDGDELRGGYLEVSDRERAERDAANRGRAARRAKTAIRRLATANALVFMWTWTFEEEPENRSEVVLEVQRGVKRLRRRVGDLRYLWVIERGSKRGRLHVHVIVDRWLPHATVREAWGLGHVWVSTPRSKGGARANALANARYLAKYVGKELAGGIDGRQAYGRSEGLTVGRIVERRRLTERDALWVAEQVLTAGGATLAVSFSGDWVDYEGPPAWWATLRT